MVIFLDVPMWVLTAIGFIGGSIIALVVATLAAFFFFAGRIPACCFTGMLQILKRSAAAVPDGEPAWPSYYFGPIFDDVRYGSAKVIEDVIEAMRYGSSTSRRLAEVFLVGPAIWLGVWIGMPAGAVLALVIAIPVALVYLAVIAVTVLIACGSCQVRRGCERLIIVTRKVRMACPDCGELVRPWPVYLCPNKECTANKHNNIRSGRYGVRRRTCQCGTILPTFLTVTSASLKAVCSNINCKGELLPEGFGVTGELIWASPAVLIRGKRSCFMR